MIDSNNLKNYAIIIWLCFLMVVVGTYAYNYINTDWEKVTQNAIEVLEGTHCEIDYKDLHYKGLCTDKEEIFQFVKDLDPYGNYSRDKDREHYCKSGAYYSWTIDNPLEYVVPSIDYNAINKWCEGADWG